MDIVGKMEIREPNQVEPNGYYRHEGDLAISRTTPDRYIIGHTSTSEDCEFYITGDRN